MTLVKADMRDVRGIALSWSQKNLASDKRALSTFSFPLTIVWFRWLSEAMLETVTKYGARPPVGCLNEKYF